MVDDFVPKDFAGLPSETEKILGVFREVGGGEVDFSPDEDGGGVTATGDGGLPADVFGLGPFGWRFGVLWSVVVFFGATPLRPVGGLGGGDECEREEEGFHVWRT